VGADGGAQVQGSGFVPEGRHLLTAAAHHGAVAGRDRVLGLHLAPRDALHQLGGDGELFADEVSHRGRLQRGARRIVDESPGIAATLHQVRQDQSRRRAGGEPLAAVARDQEQVLLAGQRADVGDMVGGLEHLPRPAVRDLAHLGEAAARPGLQRLEPGLLVVGAPVL
jgi:hypothetical protein